MQCFVLNFSQGKSAWWFLADFRDYTLLVMYAVVGHFNRSCSCSCVSCFVGMRHGDYVVRWWIDGRWMVDGGCVMCDVTLQESATALLLFRDHYTLRTRGTGWSIGWWWCGLLIASIINDNCVDSFGKDFLHTGHFLTTTLHISSSHLSCNGHPLLGGDGGKTLGFKEIDTGSFCS